MAESDQEKTEEPTPERRLKAREDGQFARGKDAGNTVASIAVLMMLAGTGDTMVDSVRIFAKRCFGRPYELIREDPASLVESIGSVVVGLVLPISAAAAFGALAWGVTEAGFHPQMKLAAPKWSRLDPLPKLKQMFMPHEAAMNVAMQLLRVFAVGIVAYLCVEESFGRLMSLGRASVQAGAMTLLDALLSLALWSSLALATLAMIDYIKSYRQHEKSIRMSIQEIKDEIKQQQGDPRVKQRQRNKAREMARKGLVQALETSDFVIANPTHISVVVRYRQSEGAPVVTAKGYDDVALYIRKLAREKGLPVIENRPLARALAKQVKAGQRVPVDLYGAVAEVLAFVYRLKNKSVHDLTGR